MMRDRGQHLSDEEILLAEDAEAGRQTPRAHLAVCARCMARAEQFQSMMAALAAAQKSSLDPAVPSIEGPRALLRARLAEQAARQTRMLPGFWRRSGLFAGSFGFAALTVLVAAVYVFGGATQRGSEARPSYLLSDNQLLPNRVFTPGHAQREPLQAICSLQHEEVVKEVPLSKRQLVFEEYGISPDHASEFEVDYLITPGLGGTDDIRNLWPEPYSSAVWNARAKDALEERLHEMVCARQLDLDIAQKAIATNWIAAYQKYVDPALLKRQISGDYLPREVFGSANLARDSKPGRNAWGGPERRSAYAGVLAWGDGLRFSQAVAALEVTDRGRKVCGAETIRVPAPSVSTRT